MRTDAASSQHESRRTPIAEPVEPVEVVAKIGPESGASLERTAVGGSLWDLPGCATVFCLGADIFGSMWNLTALRYGEAGLVADCVEPIEPGSKVSLDSRRPDTSPSAAKSSRVLNSARPSALRFASSSASRRDACLARRRLRRACRGRTIPMLETIGVVAHRASSGACQTGTPVCSMRGVTRSPRAGNDAPSSRLVRS